MMTRRILCAFAFAFVAASSSAQQIPTERPAAAGSQAAPNPSDLTRSDIMQGEVPAQLSRLALIYQKKADLPRLTWTLERLAKLLPYNGDVRLSLAATYALQEQKKDAYDTLIAMQRQGFGYDLSTNANFAKVSDTPLWKYIVDNLNANLKPFGEGKVAYTLPAGDHLYDSLAFDPKRKQLLVGSVRDGTVQILDKDGSLHDLVKPDDANGLWSVYAIATDPDDDALYVASTSSVYFRGFRKEDFGKAGVFRFRLSDGRFIDKVVLPNGAQPNTLSSLAVGKGGRVFVADGLRNVIYRLDGGALKPIVSNPHLTSLRGMAVSDDGRRLYFADHAMGISGVDLDAGKGFDVAFDPGQLVLGGIDGMLWYANTLVVIQSGMSPHRVMRLHLSKDGRSITHTMALDVARPELALPTYGAIDGDGVYVIANSQKNAYDTYGNPKAGSKPEATRIFRSDLRFAWSDEPVKVPNAMKRATPPASTPGTGPFSNVQGGSQSVSGG